MKAHKSNSVLFFLSTIWWLHAPKRIEKITRENAFEQKKKKPLSPALSLGTGISPSYFQVDLLLHVLSQKNRRKTEPTEIPIYLFDSLPTCRFNEKLEILVTTLNIGCNLQDSPPKISRSYPCAKKSAAGLLFSKKHHSSQHVKTQCFHAWFNKATKFLGIDNLTEKKLPVTAFVTSWSCSRISKRQLLILQLWNPETQNTTVETRLTATFFWLPGKNRHIFSCKKTLVNKANFFGPNSGILTGFRCTTLSLSKVQVKLVQVTVFSINELKTFSFVTGR